MSPRHKWRPTNRMSAMTSWEQLGNFVQDYGPSVALFIAVIVGLAIVYKAWPLISNFVIIVNALAELPKIHETVKEIKKEVIPNGGSSLRDAIDLTRAELKTVAERLDKHIAAVQEEAEIQQKRRDDS